MTYVKSNRSYYVNYILVFRVAPKVAQEVIKRDYIGNHLKL